MTLEHLKKMIQKAVDEEPKRLTHGNTKYNAFWIDDNSIVPNNEWKKVLLSKNVISVHSHSPENYYAYSITQSPLDPLNFGDLEVLQYMVKNKFGNTIVVFSAYGEFEYVKFTSQSNPSFLKLSRAKLRKFDRIPYEYKVKLFEDKGWDEKTIAREVLRSFCKEYNLDYKTGLRWK